MIIIALDLGCETGFTIGDDKHNLSLSGVKKFKKGKSTKKYEGYPTDTRFNDFQNFLVNITDDIINTAKEPVLIVSEKTNLHMPGYAGPQLHFGFQAIVQMLQENWSSFIRFENVPALSIKKYWLGSAKLRGKASKDAMVAKAQERYPEVKDDNEADSIALYHYACDRLVGGS